MKIVVLTPVGRCPANDHQRCVDALRTVPNVTVLREYEFTCVDQARALLLERALGTDADVYLWIDDDIVFHPNDAVKLAERCLSGDYDVLAVAYARRAAASGINVGFPADQTKVTFFQPGFVDAVGVGFGFTAVKADSMRKLVTSMPRAKLAMTRYGKKEDIEVSPIFAARIVDGRWLSEDSSFCRYARDAGLRVGVDLEPRVFHVGSYSYGLEDSGTVIERVSVLNVLFTQA